MRNVTNAFKALFASTCGLSLVLAPAIASAETVGAQAQAEGNTTLAPTNTTTVGVGQSTQNLPPPQSDHDPKPEAPAPSVSTTGVTEQAGIGGTQAYARAGVLELGGFANLTSAKDYFSLGFSPSVGYFFVDNFEISAIIGINYAKQTLHTATGNEKVSQTLVMALAEPSFHLPFSQSVYGFLGVGFGVASQSSNSGPDTGAGFAIAPRLGLNVMVGRSGIFTPALQGLYQTTEAVTTPQGAVVAVKSSFGLQAGYTVMW